MSLAILFLKLESEVYIVYSGILIRVILQYRMNGLALKT